MKKLLLVIACLLITACSSPDKETKEKTTKKDGNTTVSFVGVGDNLIHEMIYKQADRAAGSVNDGTYDFTPMYAHVKEDIKKADLAYIDQESIIGGDAIGISGYPTFNSPAQLAKDVASTGFDMVNMANNHCLDTYQKGINFSSSIWKQQKGVIAAGTYTSQEDRDTIRTIEKNGIKFSFLAYTYGTNGIEAPSPFSVAYFDEAQIKKDVAAAKKISDVVIVSAHWGDENVSAPTAFQKKYAQLFADLQVDVVIGEHPHVIQPVEWVKGSEGNKTLVVYSLGNFLSGMLDVDNVLSGMIRFDFVRDKDSKKIEVKNVKWEPLITHFTGDSKDIMNTRKDFATYKLRDYTDELAKQHGLNGVNGQSVRVDDLYARTSKIIKGIDIVK